MHRSDRRRRQKQITGLELACVLIVLLALVGLTAWVLSHPTGTRW